MSEQTKFDPSRTCDVYKDMRESWELNLQFGETELKDLRDGINLDEFGGKSREPELQYQWRKNASLAIDYCQDLINIRIDNIFRSDPVRTYDDSPHQDFIEAFLENVDGGGTNMDEFMRRALRLYYINGVDFVVDKQAAPVGVEPLTLAQERELALVPYVHAFSPLERLDWSVNHAGVYKWARYDLGFAGRSDETDDSAGDHQYLTITPDEWRLYTISDDDKSNATVQTGLISLGECPIVTFYYKQSIRTDRPKVPVSLLARVAPIARYLLNLVSQIQIDIYRNIAFLVATGVDADKIPAEITPMGCWALPDGASIEDVAGDTNHIKVKMEFAAMLSEAIIRIGKLSGATGELQSRATSGFQVEAERTDLDNEMRQTASQLEAVETEIVRLAVSRFIGTPVTVADLGYSVDYNKKFVLTPLSDMLTEIKTIVATGVHEEAPELLKIQLRKLLDALTKEEDAAYEQALGEIDNAVFSLIDNEQMDETPANIIKGTADQRSDNA